MLEIIKIRISKDLSSVMLLLETLFLIRCGLEWSCGVKTWNTKKTFDHKVDNRGKDGYQATLGEFAGSFCCVAPLRKNFGIALDDCVTFMKNHSQEAKIKTILSKQSFNPKYL